MKTLYTISNTLVILFNVEWIWDYRRDFNLQLMWESKKKKKQTANGAYRFAYEGVQTLGHSTATTHWMYLQ